MAVAQLLESRLSLASLYSFCADQSRVSSFEPPKSPQPPSSRGSRSTRRATLRFMAEHQNQQRGNQRGEGDDYTPEGAAPEAAVLEQTVPQDLGGLRLDQALARMFPEHSRSRL